MSTRTGRLVPSRGGLLVVAGLVVLLAAMLLNTRFLTPGEAQAINPPPFSAEGYAKQEFPKVARAITAKAVELQVLAPAYAASPAAAAARYGQDLGSGSYSFPLKLTGVVTEVDSDFLTLEVAGLPAGAAVRVPIGTSMSGNPVRDCTGTIRFGDFVDQTAFQSVANQFKIIMQRDVVAPADVTSLRGKRVAIIGAWTNGGPPNSFLVQPISLQAVA